MLEACESHTRNKERDPEFTLLSRRCSSPNQQHGTLGKRTVSKAQTKNQIMNRKQLWYVLFASLFIRPELMNLFELIKSDQTSWKLSNIDIVS